MKAKIKSEVEKMIDQKSIFDFSKVVIPATIAGYRTFATSSLAECARLAQGKSNKGIAARAFLAVITNGFYNGGRTPDSMKGASFKARLYNHITAGITIPAQEKDEAGVPIKMTGQQMRVIVDQIESMQRQFIIDAAEAEAAAAEAAAEVEVEAAAAEAAAAVADAADPLFAAEYSGDFLADCITFLKAQGFTVSRKVSAKPAKAKQAK